MSVYWHFFLLFFVIRALTHFGLIVCKVFVKWIMFKVIIHAVHSCFKNAQCIYEWQNCVHFLLIDSLIKFNKKVFQNSFSFEYCVFVSYKLLTYMNNFFLHFCKRHNVAVSFLQTTPGKKVKSSKATANVRRLLWKLRLT